MFVSVDNKAFDVCRALVFRVEIFDIIGFSILRVIVSPALIIVIEIEGIIIFVRRERSVVIVVIVIVITKDFCNNIYNCCSQFLLLCRRESIDRVARITLLIWHFRTWYFFDGIELWGGERDVERIESEEIKDLDSLWSKRRCEIEDSLLEASNCRTKDSFVRRSFHRSRASSVDRSITWSSSDARICRRCSSLKVENDYEDSDILNLIRNDFIETMIDANELDDLICEKSNIAIDCKCKSQLERLQKTSKTYASRRQMK